MLRTAIVEDEKNIREGLETFLSRMPEVMVEGVYSSAESALPHFLQDPPDLVVTDIVMRGKSGIDLIRTCREQGVRSRFIILSGYSEFEYAKAAVRYDVTEYLGKPVDHEELADAVRKAAEESAQDRRLKSGLLVNLILGEGDTEREAADFGETRFRVLRLNACGAVPDPAVYENRIRECARTLSGEFILCLRSGALVTGVLAEDRSTEAEAERFVQELNRHSPWGRILCGYSSSGTAGELKQKNREAEAALMHAALNGTDFCASVSLPYSLAPEDMPVMIDRLHEIEPELKRCDPVRIRQGMDRLLDEMKNDTPPCCLYEFALICLNYMQVILPVPDTKDYRQILAQAWSLESLKEQAGELMEELCRTQKAERAEESDYSFEQVLRYVNLNYMRYDLTAKTVARQMYMNPEYFSRKFKAVTGRNYNEYVTALRIEKAKELLRVGNHPASRVAELVGYQTLRYFSRVFKKVTGMTPKEYREHSVRNAEIDNSGHGKDKNGT